MTIALGDMSHDVKNALVTEVVQPVCGTLPLIVMERFAFVGNTFIIGGNSRLCLGAPAASRRFPSKSRTSRRCLRMKSDADQDSPFSKLTSAQVFKSVHDLKGVHAYSLTALRIAAGVLMIHHGSEGGFWPANFSSPEFSGFIDYIMKPYFSFLPGSLSFWAALHDYVEFWGGFLVVLGLLTRPAAFGLFGTMVAAVYFHLASTGLQGFPFGHVQNYSYNFEEPALYMLIFLIFAINGPGALSLDNVIYTALRGKDSTESE